MAVLVKKKKKEEEEEENFFKKHTWRDIHVYIHWCYVSTGGPVVKNLPANTGDKPPQGEVQQESSPHSLQLEKVLTQQWRPSTAKKKKKETYLGAVLL